MSLGKQLTVALLLLALVPGAVVSVIALRQVIQINQLWEGAGMEEALASSVTVAKQSLHRMERDLELASGPLVTRWKDRAPNFDRDAGERLFVTRFLDDLDLAFVQVYVPDSTGDYHLESAVYSTKNRDKPVVIDEEIDRWQPGKGALQSTTGAFARIEELKDGRRVAIGYLLAPDFFGRLSELQLGLGTYRALSVYARVFRTYLLVLMACLLIAVAGLSMAAAWFLSGRLAGPVTSLAEEIKGMDPGAIGRVKPAPHATQEVVELAKQLNNLTTELRGKQRELMRAERVAGSAQVARQVAHEIRNPLSTLGLAVTRLERRFDRLPEEDRRVAREVVAAMKQEFEVLDDMAENFSLLGRMSEPPMRQPVDWNALVASVAALYSGSPVAIHPKLERDLPPVLGDERSLRRCLTNLVKNGSEAQNNQGSLDICTGVDRGCVAVEVRDHGSGIPDAIRERLFQPGFTTKEGGSGLGLFLTRSIVEHHGGQLEIESSPNGTLIRLLFPPAGEMVPAA